jgi:hypothetical protein
LDVCCDEAGASGPGSFADLFRLVTTIARRLLSRSRGPQCLMHVPGGRLHRSPPLLADPWGPEGPAYQKVRQSLTRTSPIWLPPGLRALFAAALCATSSRLCDLRRRERRASPTDREAMSERAGGWRDRVRARWTGAPVSLSLRASAVPGNSAIYIRAGRRAGGAPNARRPPVRKPARGSDRGSSLLKVAARSEGWGFEPGRLPRELSGNARRTTV